LNRILCSVAVLLVLRFWTPPDGLVVCGFHYLTGHRCPLCGLTRGLFLLAKGDWMNAVHLNALSPVVFVLLFSSMLGLRPPRVMRPYAMQFCIAVIAVYGIARL
jgi:hypothetical protein